MCAGVCACECVHLYVCESLFFRRVRGGVCHERAVAGWLVSLPTSAARSLWAM